MKKNFKKFWIFANKPIAFTEFMVGFVGSFAINALVVWCLVWYLQKESTLDIATFVITLIAFLAAAYAIWQQHEAGIKQEIIGAWQVLANKAAGNSGKIEAIQFLAKQRKSLGGIDMSSDHNGGRVYLRELNVSEKELGKRADLWDVHFEGADLWKADFQGARLVVAHFEGANLQDAHFEGASLWWANFKGANLADAHFEDSYLREANFQGANLVRVRFQGANLEKADFQGARLDGVDFEGSKYFYRAIFKDNYITLDSYFPPEKGVLPKAPEDSKYKFIYKFIFTHNSEPELNKEGKPTGRTKHFIKLVSQKQLNQSKT